MGAIEPAQRSQFKPRRGRRAWMQALEKGIVEQTTCGFYTVPASHDIRDRALDEHILNLIIDGGLQTRINGQNLVLPAGSVIWVPAGQVHDFSLQGTRPYTMINTRWRLYLDRRPCVYPEPFLAATDRWDLRPLFELMMDDRHGEHPQALDRARRVLYLLYTDLYRQTPSPNTGPSFDKGQRLALITYFHDHVHERLSPAKLAAVVSLSNDHFRRVFRNSFGCAPNQWMVRERIQLAAQRLQEQPSRRISDIAHDFGYSDLYQFSRQFKQVMGMSPRSWLSRR